MLDQAEIHKLAQDEDAYVRGGAAYVLGSNFSQFPNKSQAWQDLHGLADDKDRWVQGIAARSFGLAFSQFPDKSQAWQDLHRLTKEEDSSVRWRAAYALGLAFSHVPYTLQAWQDLHRLTHDKNSYVRGNAAYALGAAFNHVPDKSQAWQDLHRLTKDNSYVRMYAYHSLGRASVFNATKTNDIDTMKKELQAAIEFFERSSQESTNSPARFCSPFYRSYFAVVFQGAKKEEVQRYLAEAREAIGGSESKDELLKAVENLARALQVAQSLKDRPFHETASELNTCRLYCEKAAEHMAAAEDEEPGEVELMKMGNPFLEEQIQATIEEIQDIARQICQLTTGRGPAAEAFCGQVKDAAKSLPLADSNEILVIISDLDSILREKCVYLPEGERDLVTSQLNGIARAGPIPEKLDGIKMVVKFYLSRIQKDDEFLRKLGEMDKKLDEIHEINQKLDEANNMLKEIRYSVFRQRISFGNAIPNLTAMKTELEKLHQIAFLYPNSSLKELYSSQEGQLQELSENIDNRFVELNELLKEKASREDIKKLEQIKPAETWSSKFWDKADKGAILSTYISFLKDSIDILRPLLIV